MVISFAGKQYDVRSIQIEPGRLRLGDIILGPGGNLLLVQTIQRNCPIWESNRRTESHYILETDSHEIVPVRTLPPKMKVFRPRKAA